MRFYVNPNPQPVAAQALAVLSKGVPYHFCLLHTTLGEERPAIRVRPVAEHQHPLYHLVLFKEGKNTCTVGGQALAFKPGTLVVTSPGETHDFMPREHGGARYDELTFSFLTTDRRARALTLPFHQCLGEWAGVPLAHCRALELNVSQATRYSALLEEIQRRKGQEKDRPGLWALEPVMALFGLVVTLWLALPGEVAPDNPVEIARRHLEAHLVEIVPMKDLEGITGLRAETLIRSFKKTHGLPPVAWQHHRRMESAALLLTSTDLPAGEIATRLGYGDTAHFSRMFKKIRGVPPSWVRRSGGGWPVVTG
jgi:AraC-like DNA-binding protein